MNIDIELIFDKSISRNNKLLDKLIHNDLINSITNSLNKNNMYIHDNIDNRIPNINMNKLPKIEIDIQKNIKQYNYDKINILDYRIPKLSISNYKHNYKKCWICNSKKSIQRKVQLHRYMYKKYNRKWNEIKYYNHSISAYLKKRNSNGKFKKKHYWISY